MSAKHIKTFTEKKPRVKIQNQRQEIQMQEAPVSIMSMTF